MSWEDSGPMIAEPAINKEKLLETIHKAYGIRIEHLTSVSQGMVTYRYLVESREGDRYLLKLYRPSRVGRLSAAKLDFALALTWNLYPKRLFPNVPYPIRTQSGAFKTTFAGQPLVLTVFINGEVLGHEPHRPKPVLIALAKAVARIHRSGGKIGIEIPYVERFAIPFEEELRQALEILERGTARNAQGTQKLGDLLLPRRAELFDHLARLHELQQLARARPREMVLCHTDLHGDNLMIDGRGELCVLDWEGAMLAPPEHDLFFFTGEDFATFLTHYEQEYGSVHLDADLFSFYFHRRNLEDLTDWVVQILYENEDEAQDEDDLAGIVEDCLSGWPYLEADRKLREQISQRRDETYSAML